MAVMDHRFFIKERYMNKGKLQLTLLAPALNQFIRRIGFYDKETCCKVFEFCLELVRDDLVEAKGVTLKSASPKAKAKQVLPDETKDVSAKASKKKSADETKLDLTEAVFADLPE